MYIWSKFLLLCVATLMIGCGPSRPATPVETFKTYVKAIKAKDPAAMKLLLSTETIKMHEQEAKAQGVTVDEIVLRETLFSESQRTVEYRNEKIDENKATLEVKNSYGSWETLPFIREDGVWKIDKKGYADQMLRDIEEEQRRVFDPMNVEPLSTPDPFSAPQEFATPLPPPENSNSV